MCSMHAHMGVDDESASALDGMRSLLVSRRDS